MTKVQKVGKKAKEVLGSLRFWIVTLTAIVAILEQLTLGDASLEYVFNVVQAWLVAVAGIGTLDSVAEKFGAKAAGK